VTRMDLDNDTDMDLVVEMPRYGRLQVFENRGGGDFRRVLEARKWDAYPTVVCDIDDDGLVDVAAGGPGKEEITIYLNRTPGAGRFCKLCPRMPRPNWAAIGATVQVYHAGSLGQPHARPYLAAKANPDGQPIHIGLGKARRMDMRVIFPEQPAIELKNVEAGERLEIFPGGRLSRRER
jgi:hypothetical protein